MTKEQFEQAKELEKTINHITEVIGFIKYSENSDNFFICTENDDYQSLNSEEVVYILDVLEKRKSLLEHEFERL